MREGEGKEIVSPERDVYDMTVTSNNHLIVHNKKLVVT